MLAPFSLSSGIGARVHEQDELNEPPQSLHPDCAVHIILELLEDFVEEWSQLIRDFGFIFYEADLEMPLYRRGCLVQ